MFASRAGRMAAISFGGESMKRSLYIIIFVVAFMTGCGALMPEKARLLGAARYEDLARHMEGNISDMHKASNQDIIVLVHCLLQLEELQQIVSLSR